MARSSAHQSRSIAIVEREIPTTQLEIYHELSDLLISAQPGPSSRPPRGIDYTSVNGNGVHAASDRRLSGRTGSQNAIDYVGQIRIWLRIWTIRHDRFQADLGRRNGGA